MTIFGHDHVFGQFAAATTGARLHHAWLFAGPKGVGKATSARELTKELLVKAVDPDVVDIDAHPMAKLLNSGAHSDFKLLKRMPKDDKSTEPVRNITIAQIRALINAMSTKPAMSARRVVIIDSIDDLERNAANALLKVLEEPPAGTIFLLVSHAPSRLLPTIKSRCRRIDFGPLSDEDMATALAQLIPDADTEERRELVALGHGAPGKALALAKLDLASLSAALSSIAATGDPDNGERVKIAKMFAGKAAQPRFEAFMAQIPPFIAQQAREASPERVATVIEQWDKAQILARSAVGQSFDPQSAVFAVLGHVAALAPRAGAAKA